MNALPAAPATIGPPVSPDIAAPRQPWWVRWGVDWSQAVAPGPTRRFTDEELQRAGRELPGRTFWVVLLLNLAPLLWGEIWLAPAGSRWVIAAIGHASLVATAGMVVLQWRRPMRLRSCAFAMAWAVVSLPSLLWLRTHAHVLGAATTVEIGNMLSACMLVGTSVVWTLTLYRAHQIEARLKELDEQDAALALARRLSAAQLQPHFLFNTLASIQHWVDVGDGRAGTTLQALTGYLRALLPMFEAPLHPLADELAAMERYLAVMQARLGARLRFGLQVDPAVARAATLPPGLGLTLLENAVEHGVQASLHGAAIEVRVRRDPAGATALLEVVDDGPGFAVAPTEGVGLRNCRQRLAQAYGTRAVLALAAGPAGTGCTARVELPLPSDPSLPEPANP